MRKISDAQIMSGVKQLRKIAAIKKALSTREKILLGILGITGTGALGASTMGGGSAEEEMGMGDNIGADIEKQLMEDDVTREGNLIDTDKMLREYLPKNDKDRREKNKKTAEEQFGWDSPEMDELMRSYDEKDKKPKNKAKSDKQEDAWQGVDETNKYGEDVLARILGKSSSATPKKATSELDRLVARIVGGR